MKTKPVLLIGDANFDKVIRLPPADRCIDALIDLVPRSYAGGTMGNAATALVHLGLDVTLLFAVGADGYGTYVVNALAGAGVDVRQAVIVPDRYTLTVTIVIDRSGQRYFSRFPTDDPASIFYPPDKLSLETVRQARWLHVCGWLVGYGPTGDTILRAMMGAKDAGIPISVDLNLRPISEALPESYRQGILQAIELSDYIFGSGSDEFTMIAGVSDPIEAALTFASNGCTVIARFGSDGAIVVTPSGEVTRVPAFKTEVVDTLGAGDTFDAGFIAAILEGESVVEAARWGNAVAAISIAHEGATGHITREGLDSYIL